MVLPSSFGGGDRAMAMNYQDAMAIVRVHGKPGFFITFTANPSWPDVTTNLGAGEHPVNCPDLVARVAARFT